MPSVRRARLLSWMLVSLGVTLAINIAPYQVDDAYITYRYANHFASRGEITFNPGRPPVEGFTSPLWFLLLTAGSTLFGPDRVPQVAITLGLLTYAALLGVVWRLATGAGLWPAVVSLALVALSPDLAFYAVTGMDALLLPFLALVVVAATQRRAPPSCGALAGFLAPWARPEASALPLLVGVFVLATTGAEGLRTRRYWSPVAALALGGTVLVACRLAIFGELLPNTYFAKPPQLGEGLSYVASRLSSPATGGLIALGALGAWRGTRLHRGFAAAGAAWVAVVVAEGGDWMPHARFLLPTVVFFGLAAAGFALPAGDTTATLRPAHRRAARVAVALATLAVLATSVVEALTAAYVAKRTVRTRMAELQPLLDAIEATGAASIGLVDIGQLGFHSPIEVIDLGGLVDRTVAHSPGGHLAKRIDPSYLFGERRPDLLLFRFRAPPRGEAADGSAIFAPGDASSVAESWILREPQLRESYRPILTLLPDYPRDPYEGRVLFLHRSLGRGEAAPARPTRLLIRDPL